MSSPPPRIVPYRIPRGIRTAIGEIVLLGAEVDHLVSMALFSIAKVHPPNGFIILKRMMLGDKLARLSVFVDAHGDPLLSDKFSDIEKQLTVFSKIRNQLAHGVYIGKELNREALAFSSIPDHYPGAQSEFIHQIILISENSIREAVVDGRAIQKKLKEAFDVKSLHETFPSQYYADKPPSRKDAHKNRSAKSQRPPQSSRG